MRTINVFSFYIGLGEVMITQVSGFNASSSAKDPRRKAQSIRLKHISDIPYRSNYEKEYREQQKNALQTSITIVLGSVLFTMGYFLFSKKAKA